MEKKPIVDLGYISWLIDVINRVCSESKSGVISEEELILEAQVDDMEFDNAKDALKILLMTASLLR